jgi:hypothetical protein
VHLATCVVDPFVPQRIEVLTLVCPSIANYRLVAFTCVLALCNLGTSFAAAYIAKDAKAEDDKLTSTSTGNVLATDSSTTIFKVDKEFSERRHRERRLICETSNGGKNADCATGAFANGVLNIPFLQGQAIAKACQKGGSVTIEVTHDGGALVDHQVCPPAGGSISCPSPGTMVGNGGAAFCQDIVVPHGVLGHVNVAKADDTTYTVTNLVGAIGAACSSNTDCASNAICDSNTCKYKHGTSGCSTSEQCAEHNECITTSWGSNVCSCTNDSACDADVSTAAFTCQYRARSWTSECGCENHSDCTGVDAVCAHMCGVDMDDAPAHCTTQSSLDSMCGDGETCSADPRKDGESVRFCERVEGK